MYLLDTNVLSEMRKVRRRRTDARFCAWAATLEPATAWVSAITIHEIEFDISRLERRDPPQAVLLRRWFAEEVMTAFSTRILPVDGVVAIAAADLRVPDPAPIADSLIAATALVHGLTVATRNAADFRRVGVDVLNPWEFPLPPPPGDEIS